MNDWKNYAQRDNRPVRDIIRERIEMLAAVFSRKISEEMILVFQEALERYPQGALKKAFTTAEQNLEKFPTPKVMRALSNSEMPSRLWQYNFPPSHDLKGTPCLVDPNPDCDKCREPKDKHPHDKCHGFEGSPYMYRPQNCPEGRAFLDKFAELAGRKDMPKIYIPDENLDADVP